MAYKHIGFVSYHEFKPGLWLLRYRDPYSGSDVKVKVRALNEDAARDHAKEHDLYCQRKREERPDKRRKVQVSAFRITVEDAMTQAEVTVKSWQPKPLQAYRNDAKRFRMFLLENYGIEHWAKVRFDHIQDYDSDMKARECSRDRRRLCLIPVKKTSRHMAKAHPDCFADVYGNAEISLGKAADPDPVALEWNEAADLVEFLQAHFPDLYPLAILILATGLRQYEAAHIRPGNVNPASRELTLTATDAHAKLKNDRADKPIPYPAWAFSGVQSWPIDQDAPLFLDNEGRPWTAGTLNDRLKDAIKALRAQKIVPDRFTFKHLRTTFATQAAECGVSDLYIQRMMRHAPNSVLAKHYTKIKPPALALKMEPFWNLRLGLTRKSNETNVEKSVN